MNRKEIRKRARQALKTHYWIFVAACLLAAILGTEHTNSLQLFRLQKRVQERQSGSPVSALGVVPSGELSVFNDIINGNLDGAIQSVKHRMDVYTGKDTYIGDVELGHSRGVLSSVVNTIASGALLFNLLTLIDTILGSQEISVILLSLLGFLLMLTFWLFIGNVYRVGYSRVFLEGRLYKKVPFSRFVFLYRIRKHIKASFTMALYMLLTYLWLFTIVLFPVKRYAYFLVPFLTAENPDLSATEAIRLSKRMMKGHKWEAFLLELSLLPWTLLSFGTGGLLGMLFVNPYREAAFAEYYAHIRRLSLESNVEGTEKLNDRFLFEVPERADLTRAYADIDKLSRTPRTQPEPRKGFWGFLEKYFGIVLSYDRKEKEYREWMRTEQKIGSYSDTLEGRTYPARLFPIPEKQRRKKSGDGGYLRHYPLTSLILVFFAGCMFGWTWEVVLHLLQAGEFVNRGVLHGPWLPIYGGGILLILVILYRFRKSAFTQFWLIVVLCGIVEYMTSWILEILHDGQRWWDYKGYYLNLNGRICAEGLLVFGIGGAAVVYVAAPLIDDLLEQVSQKILWPLCAVLLLVFGADVVYSAFVPNTGKGVTASSAYLENGTQLPGRRTASSAVLPACIFPWHRGILYENGSRKADPRDSESRPAEALPDHFVSLDPEPERS